MQNTYLPLQCVLAKHMQHFVTLMMVPAKHNSSAKAVFTQILGISIGEDTLPFFSKYKYSGTFFITGTAH